MAGRKRRRQAGRESSREAGSKGRPVIMQVFRLAGRKAEARCCQAGKLVGRQTGRQVGM